MSDSVLVTGAGGFLAGPLVAELRARPPRRLVLSARAPGAGRAAADLRDPAAADALVALARPTLVYHLAGTTRPLDWSGLWDAHVHATVNLLSALRRRGAPARVVIVGSSAEYGASAGTSAVRESLPTEPLTDYGRSKLSQTLAALSFNGDGLEIVVARVFNAIGPGIPERLALGAFARQLASARPGEKRELRAGNLSPRRDLVDARDAAEAFLALARGGRAGEVYNVCSGRAVSVGRMLRRLIELSGLEAAVLEDPARRRAVDLPTIHGSYAKIHAQTGWRPRLSLDESLRDTLSWLRRRPRP